jgi:hypothetical protein
MSLTEIRRSQAMSAPVAEHLCPMNHTPALAMTWPQLIAILRGEGIGEVHKPCEWDRLPSGPVRGIAVPVSGAYDAVRWATTAALCRGAQLEHRFRAGRGDLIEGILSGYLHLAPEHVSVQSRD